MTALVWDKVGERRYETGIDRGVLYLPDGNAVPWNGLTSVVETRTREVKSYYLDGIKYLDHSVPGSYVAKLQAYTYPVELDSLLGNADFAPGVVLYDQNSSWFHLSYRTRIANDILGTDFGYKIHVVYNVVASPSDADFETLSDSVAGKPLEWNLTGTPDPLLGIRPTNHISLDSTTMDSDTLETLETSLYGSSSADPYLPKLVDLLNLVASP